MGKDFQVQMTHSTLINVSESSHIYLFSSLGGTLHLALAVTNTIAQVDAWASSFPLSTSIHSTTSDWPHSASGLISRGENEHSWKPRLTPPRKVVSLEVLKAVLIHLVCVTCYIPAIHVARIL